MSAALSHLTSRQGFERDRAQIRRLLLVMAGHVESMISASVRAFSTRDAELARHTIAVDAKVNRAECECDDLCLATLTAGGLSEADVRFVCLAMKMVVDLERIGDLAVNVCERAIDLAHEPPCRSYEDIHRMADLVKLMVRGAIDAFVN
ncbi:MAG: phosphate transport system regulatory protein PhoU, partial [Myxococcales bacterium]|nr:phosphate transport system regulatory protein PhoU [Myxococcales bacterium]